MSENFLELKYLGGRVKVELDQSNYATKADFKNAAGVDTSKFAYLKSNVDKLDIDKLKNVPTNLSKLVPVPVDLSKLSDAVRNYVVKKDVCNAKIKNVEDKMPDITNLATNTTFNAKINEVKGEIPRITNLASNVSLNTKINEVKGKIPNITNLATTTAVAAVENNTKISEIENKIATDHDCMKYITTQEFSKLTSENFNARLKKANLAS